MSGVRSFNDEIQKQLRDPLGVRYSTSSFITRSAGHLDFSSSGTIFTALFAGDYSHPSGWIFSQTGEILED